MRKAVIDVGSNSVLLLVEEFVEGVWQEICHTTAVTSLGENTKKTGLLAEDRIVDTLAALVLAFDKAHTLGCESVYAGVTMAGRIARNADDFVARAAAQGTPVQILSGEQEAQLGFEAVAYDTTFANEQRISIIDIGGQSTELVTADRVAGGWEIRYRNSFAIGTLALRSGVLEAENPDAMAALNAVQQLDETIGLAYLPGQCGTCIVLGATGTNLVSIREAFNPSPPDPLSPRKGGEESTSTVPSGHLPLTPRGRIGSVSDPSFPSNEGEVARPTGATVEVLKSDPLGQPAAASTPTMGQLTGPNSFPSGEGWSSGSETDGVIQATDASAPPPFASAHGPSPTGRVLSAIHGAYLDYEEISKAWSWLAAMSLEERSQVPGIEHGREKTLHVGALILERFLFALRSCGCRVSVRGWRHSLLERGLPSEIEHAQQPV